MMKYNYILGLYKLTIVSVCKSAACPFGGEGGETRYGSLPIRYQSNWKFEKWGCYLFSDAFVAILFQCC